MNKIKRIILDVDHVIAMSDVSFLKAYESIMRIKPLAYQTKKWDFTDCLPNIDKSQIMSIFASDEFFENLEPYPRVVEEIAKVREMGIEVIIASQCSPWSVGKKAQWIDKHFPSIGQYPKVDYGKSKDYLALGDGDLFIDDHWKILDTVSAEYKLMFVGVEDRDWQQEYKYKRRYSWDGFAEWVIDFNLTTDYINIIKGENNE